MKIVYWLVLFVILLIIEICTLGLTTIWFAGGAAAAFIVGALGLGTMGQTVVFLASSIALLASTRPIAVKYFNKERTKTNAESLIGKTALVVEAIDTLHFRGKVEINGQEWSARTVSPEGRVEEQRTVTIKEIQGVKLIVEEKEA